MKIKNKSWKKGSLNEKNILLTKGESICSCKSPTCSNRYIKKQKNKIIKFCPKCRNGKWRTNKK